MIYTGIPYDPNLMLQIQKNGAIVDLSDINFKKYDINTDDQLETLFIYLRNTNFNVTYDFSKVLYENKQKFILKYFLNNDIITMSQLPNTLMNILCVYLNQEILEKDKSCILTEQEIKTFIKRNQLFVKNIITLIISFPVFLILNLKQKTIINDLTNDEQFFINNNFIPMLTRLQMFLIFQHENQFQKKNFTKIFNMNTNHELFVQIHNNFLFSYVCKQLI